MIAAGKFLRGHSGAIIDYLDEMASYGLIQEELLEIGLDILNQSKWTETGLEKIFSIFDDELEPCVAQELKDGIMEIVGN